MSRSAQPASPGPERSRAHRVLPAAVAGVASGILLAMAFPPADVGPLAFVALTPLAYVFLRPWRYSLTAASTAFALTFFGLLLSWVRLFGPEAYAGLLIGETAFVVGALAAGRRAMGRLPPRWAPVVFPLAFLAGEYLRARLLFGGFGWGGLGYTQHDNLPLLRLASYTGVWGVGLVAASTAVLVERAVTAAGRDVRKALVCLTAALVVVLAPGLLPVPSARGPAARLAVVQGNAPEDTADPHADDLSVLGSHASLTRGLAGRRLSLVIWPESAVDLDPRSNADVERALVDSQRAIEAPLLVGATLDEPDARFRNSSILYGPEGPIERYDKQHLVPFGEYVPFRKRLVPLIEQLRQVPRDGIPGRRPVVFRIREGKLATAICFESTFPGIVRRFVAGGARLLVVSTNDSSFERTAAARQHLAFAQLRAAENRMWVVQGALTGISAFVAPDGRVTARTGLFRPAVLEGDVRFATGRTLYGLLGDWLPIGSLIAVAGLALARRPRGG